MALKQSQIIMNNTFEVKICDKCPTDSQICPQCHGKKVWIEGPNSKKYYVSWTTTITPETISFKTSFETVLRWLNILTLLLTVFFFALLFTNHSLSYGLNPWKHNLNQIAFGLFGLITIALFVRNQPKTTRLETLTDIVGQTDGTEEWICLDKFVDKEVFSAINQASIFAQKFHYNEITPEVFLLASVNSNSIRSVLGRMEINPDNLFTAITGQIVAGNQGHNRQILLTQTIEVLLYSAIIYSVENQYLDIQLWNVLPIYIRDNMPLKETLEYFKISPEKLKKIFNWYQIEDDEIDLWNTIKLAGATRPKGDINKGWTALPTPTLNKISKDLTFYASYGIGNFSSIRQKELTRSMQVLSRNNKRSVILVGDPGTGKGTIVESIAGLMVEEKVPTQLKDKRLVSLDIVDLINTTKESEAVFFKILDEIYQAENVILYMPNIENIINNEDQVASTASTLKSALQENKMQMISTSTVAQYHKYIENNSALEAAFEVILLEPLSEKDCLTVLEEETPKIENEQKVFFSLPALEKAVNLASRYLTTQALPEAAIELLDEAASAMKSLNKRWVYATDVTKILEGKTQIKVEDAGAGEADLLLNFEQLLKKRIVGQEMAVKAVSAALRRSRTGMHSENRPISTFLFVGPTGVGKTELSKAVTELFFGDKRKMITLDMTEYQEETSVNKIIGAPQSSSDSRTEGSILTKFVKDNPYCLILLDEIEKCHASVQNLFLQLLDEGRLTDNTGTVVNFRNTIIIATSNAGSTDVYNLIKNGARGDELNKQVILLLNEYFKPEFLNRFDAIVPFHPLTTEQVKQIVLMMLEEVKVITSGKGYTISFSDDAVTYLAENGYDALYGARPLRRIIQDKVETLLADLILEKKLEDGSQLQIDAEMLKYLK